MPNYPIRHGGKENGGTIRMLRAIEGGDLPLWDWTPDFMWRCRIDHTDLRKAGAVQTATVTIPSSGFVSGALTLTFAGGGLASPVLVTEYAAVGSDEEDLGALFTASITALTSTTLLGVIASANDSTGVVTISSAAGITPLTVTAAWRSAEVYTGVLSGTLINADYTITIDGGGLGAAVATTTTRAAGTPAAITDMIIQIEADLEGLIATTLADVLVSANDDATDTNTLQFEPDIADVTVTSSLSQLSWASTVGGTATDGTYTLTFAHADLPSDVDVSVVRSTTPATNDDLAAAMETAVEANVQLFAYVASATATGAVNAILAHPGVTGLTVTASAAPSPGTLTVVPLVNTIADATPAGPTVTVGYTTVVNLNQLGGVGSGPFPAHVMRHTVALEVETAFVATSTITIGDAAALDGLLGSTPVALDATGRTLAIAADSQYRTQYEAGLVPVATIDTGAANIITSGRAHIQIDYSPHPSGTSTSA